MKKPIVIRVLAAVGGVLLCLASLCALAETFFHLQLMARIAQLMNAGTPLAVLVTLLLAILLCACGVCCLLMLSTRRAMQQKGYVMQKGENGMIGVSVKSIEGLVQTCVRQHEMIAGADISVAARHDGIVILLRVEEAAGVNIPLAIGALQKQIKQYVNTCTGLDVHEVRVMVENTEETVAESPYSVESAIAAAAAVVEQPAETIREAPVTMPAPVEEAPEADVPVAEAAPVPGEAAPAPAEAATPQDAPAVSVPVVPVIPEMPEIPAEEDDRPLHQRLFGAEDQPVFVPAPPELVLEPQAEEADAQVEAPAAEYVEEVAQEELPAEAIDANAVLEVVEAIGAEEAAEAAHPEATDTDEAIRQD